MDYIRSLNNEYKQIFLEYLNTYPSKDDFQNMCWREYMGEYEYPEIEEYELFIEHYLRQYFSFIY